MARTGPIGPRVSAVRPDIGARKANFVHSVREMLSETLAVMPAATQAAWKALTRGLALPSASPNSSTAKLPICLMTPGSAMCAAMRAAPSTTLPGPTIRPMRAPLSTPFWKVKMVAPPAASARSDSAALSVSRIFTAKMTASAAAISRASATTLTGLRCRLPSSLSSRRPPLRIASSWAPRATNVTSLPAAARRAPK